VEADPADPLAYAGLALGYVTVAHSAEAQADSSTRKAAARTALKLDPSQAEAAAALGLVEGYHDWSWDDGFRNLERALDANPASPSLTITVRGLAQSSGAWRRPSRIIAGAAIDRSTPPHCLLGNCTGWGSATTRRPRKSEVD